MIWNLGAGKIFYFRPGHETYPVFKESNVMQIITNAVYWMAQ
jgi:trehalose utilization protein